MTNIFLDADGVLCNFNAHSHNLFGGHPRELTFECPERGLLKADEALWAHVDNEPTFWSHMPFFEWADELVDFARPHNVTILTGCPKDGGRAAEEKKIKFNSRWPDVPVITCRARDKSNFMKAPGDILVDDFIANIKRWEKAGGVGVYFKTFDAAMSKLRGLV